MRYKGDVRMLYIVHTFEYAMSNNFKIFEVCRFFKLLLIPVVACCSLAKIDFSRGSVVPCWLYFAEAMMCCVKRPANIGAGYYWCIIVVVSAVALFCFSISQATSFSMPLPIGCGSFIHRNSVIHRIKFA